LNARAGLESAKRGLRAPLLFAALFLAARGSVEASPLLWLSALTALGGAAWLLRRENASGVTLLGACTLALALWIAMTNFWASASYSAAAPYHAAFLVGGFLVGRTAGADNARLLLCTVLLFVLGLGVWALGQRFCCEGPRAQALFETPATLSATINLALLPVLALVGAGRSRAILSMALVVLVAASVAAGSRGGWVSLAAGCVIAAVLARRAQIRIDWRAAAALASVSALTVVAAVFLQQSPQAAAASAFDAGSTISRLDLYRLALEGISASSLLFGNGYLSFYYFLEAVREPIAGYSSSITYFVHNDYLQALLELGAPGLAGLVAVAVLPQAQVWRAVLSLPDHQKPIAVGLAAAAGSMAIHAFVDFPFYVPLCLLLYGGATGMIDSLAPQDVAARVPGMLIAAGIAFAIWMLATPVVAQAAAAYAHRQWQTARGESAAYWFEVARRVESRDWRYHWYAGQFWYAQALETRKPEAARLAERAFADGMAANPREVRNVLGRISTHLRLSALLAAPADAAALRAWSDRALALAPRDPAVQAEAALVRHELGERTGRR
jgi:O-antigen ligase